MKSMSLRFASMAVLVPALVIGSYAYAPAANNTAAVVGGIIAGAAVGAAIGSATLPKTIYVNPGPPRPVWGAAYSPKPGINCYPAQKACYKDNGAYAPQWTWRVYAR
jgi:hypothetical protein